MVQIDLSLIEQKKKMLEQARIALKSQFIGIDNIIDDLLNYIQIWYLMPEVLNRPIIINLWGMTGVGKTDLVRQLVKHLHFQDRFAEVELSNLDSSSWSSSVGQLLSAFGVADEKPSIVLFDEIQRFNTLDHNRAPVQRSKFTDFWELLSDGRLSKKGRFDIDYQLQSYLADQKAAAKRKKSDEDEDDDDRDGFLSMWELQRFSGILDIDMTAEELPEITEVELIDKLRKAKREKKIYEPVNYSKMLIIISGNLDDAFSMSTDTSETDVDADIFHAFTKKITLVDIKNSLSRKFRPEQVARFGNIHLIYNSLRRTDFEQIIDKEVKRIIASTQERFGIALHVDNSMQELIYRNGVFPVQGARPVFSSVIDILESNLSKCLYIALMNGHQYISLAYDAAQRVIHAVIGNTTLDIPYEGRIDKIREQNVQDTIASISVHESGHAVAYMMLMGLAPLQLKSKVASSYANGFTFPHQIHDTKDNLIKKIKIYLAGGIAEEIIFGTNNASIGRSHDREVVTELASDYVRRYGFEADFQATYALETHAHSLDTNITDNRIEQTIKELVQETNELLTENIDLLKALSIELSLKGSLLPEEMAQISQRYGVNVLVKEEGFLVINNFDQQLRALIS